MVYWHAWLICQSLSNLASCSGLLFCSASLFYSFKMLTQIIDVKEWLHNHFATGQYKMQTADCRPGTKCRLGTKYRLQTAD